MAFIFNCSSHCELNSKTTSYVTLLSNSMGLTFGQERKNISARWNKSLMLPLCLNMDWLQIYSKKNPVQSISPSMTGAKLSQNLQTLCVAGFEYFFLYKQYCCCGFFFFFSSWNWCKYFYPFDCISKFCLSDIPVDHNIFAMLLSCLLEIYRFH